MNNKLINLRYFKKKYIFIKDFYEDNLKNFINVNKMLCFGVPHLK